MFSSYSFVKQVTFSKGKEAYNERGVKIKRGEKDEKRIFISIK